MVAHINIGSNLGSPEENIRRAVDAIAARFPVLTQSDMFVSAPWGFSSSHRFVNTGINIGTAYATSELSLSPQQLLKELLEIQNAICVDSHRDALGRYTDRIIDIDLILLTEDTPSKSSLGESYSGTEGTQATMGNFVLNLPEGEHGLPALQLPHPRMHLRDFVLRPLMQILPGWRHPLFGKTAAEMLAELPQQL